MDIRLQRNDSYKVALRERSVMFYYDANAYINADYAIYLHEQQQKEELD